MTTFSDAAWKDMHDSMWYVRGEARLLVREMFDEDLRITSGRRPPNPARYSFHADGKACDIGVQGWTVEAQRRFATELQRRLGEDFQVVLEGPAATDPKYLGSQPHVHVEYQPKGRHATG